MSYNIRDASPDERAEIARVTRAAYTQYAAIMDPVTWRGLSGAIDAALASDEPVERIVATIDGRIVGSAMLYPAKANAYGDEARRVSWPEARLVAVAPEARGLGVARALMEECARRARAAGATALGIHTSRSMTAAIRLYASMGFVRVPEHDFQPPGGELVEGYRMDLGTPVPR